jgi:shikimate 5-dehydrogenase
MTGQKWVEISSILHESRFTCLSSELAKAGIENQVEYIQVSDKDTFEKVLTEVKERFTQVRVGGLLCELLPSLLERMPANLLSLKAADAMLLTAGEWWPHNFLTEGLGRALVKDLKTLDLSGGAFILGANCEARAVVASLIRLGFTRFSISDPDNDRGQKFVDSIRTTYFGVTCQFVARHSITQLPSVHTMAVNVIEPGADDGALGELFYFNFLRSGGVWLDLALPGSQELEAEARAVGSRIESGYNVAAWTDFLWAKEAFGVDLDVTSLAHEYAKAFTTDSAAFSART